MAQYLVEAAVFQIADLHDQRQRARVNASMAEMEQAGVESADPVAAGIAERQRVFAAAGEAA